MPIFIITLLTVLLDQVTKLAVNANMKLYDSVAIIPGVLDFTYIRNNGAAWGMLDDKRWVFLVMSTVSIAFIIFILAKYRNGHIMMKLPLALILGGGIGNMIDRIFYTNGFLDGVCKLFGEGYRIFDGVVIDFIEAAFIDFPVFNIADCAVTVGTALLFVYVIFIDGRSGNKPPDKEKTVPSDETVSGDGEKSE